MPQKAATRRRWLHGWKPHPRHAPVYWKRSKIKRLVKKLFKHRWVSARDYHRGPILGDSEYYLPTLTEAATIIRNSKVDRETYASLRFDCEDFAFVLKAHFCQAAYQRKRRKYAYCFGIIWGEDLWMGSQSGAHAMNWMITSDGVFRLVEPQTGRTRELKDRDVTDRKIYLLLA